MRNQFTFSLQKVNFGPVNNPGAADTNVILEIAFDTDLGLAFDQSYATTIKVGTLDDFSVADFAVIENVSDFLRLLKLKMSKLTLRFFFPSAVRQ